VTDCHSLSAYAIMAHLIKNEMTQCTVGMQVDHSESNVHYHFKFRNV